MRQRLDGGLPRIKLTPAVVGHDEAVRAQTERRLGVFFRHHAFDDQLALPAIPQGADLVGIQAARKGPVHEQTEVLHAQPFRQIGLHRLKLWRARSEL